MITKEKISDGLEIGTVYLGTDPNMGSGAVAFIGANWFYFGGQTAEEMTPEEYLREVPKEDVVNEIFTALQGIRGIDEDEYDYYDAILAMDKTWFRRQAVSGANKLCDPKDCTFQFDCGTSQKGKSSLRKVGPMTECPLRKYPKFEKDHEDDQAVIPTLDEIFALCGRCENGQVVGDAVHRKDITACFDCPVKIAEEYIQETAAEAASC